MPNHKTGMNKPSDNSTNTANAVPTAPASAPIAKPRIGIVGCGTVGGVHRDRLLALPNVEVAAICDPDSDALARMAQSLPKRPRLFRSELDLLQAGMVDAVVLCTPHARHALQIRRALDAGVHVLCEKPFVTHHGEGDALVRLAREKNLALFVAYTRRSRGHANFLVQAAQRIGPLTDVIITRAQPWQQMHGKTWRMHESEGGGFLLDAGASMLDLLFRLVGNSPVRDANAELSRFGGVDVDVQASVRLVFLSGTRADITLLGDATEKVERIQLFGQNGTAGWLLREDVPAELYVRPLGGPSESINASPFRTLSPDEAFVAALEEGGPFGDGTPANLYDAASAVPVVDLVERLYRDALWR